MPNRQLVPILEQVTRLNVPVTENSDVLVPIGKNLLVLNNLSSKEIRNGRDSREQMVIFKCGLVLSIADSLNYMEKIRRLTSTKQKCTILRFLHGDIYTNERLMRFGLRNDSQCDHCGQVDTLEHRLTACDRTKILLEALEAKTRPLRTINFDHNNYDQITRLLAAYKVSDIATISVQSEVLMFLLTTKDTPAQIVVNIIINRCLKLEGNKKIKNQLRSLFEN